MIHLVGDFDHPYPKLLFCSPLTGDRRYAGDGVETTSDIVRVTCPACQAEYARVSIGRSSGQYEKKD